MSDPAILLDWMASRGPGDITMRAIGDTGPRSFRRKVDADPAIAALIEAGAIVEVSARPLAFRVVDAEAVSDVDLPALEGRQAEPPTRPRTLMVRRPDDAEIRAAIRQAYDRRRGALGDAAAIVEAASAFRAALIREARGAAGLACECPSCGTAAAFVDCSIVEALNIAPRGMAR